MTGALARVRAHPVTVTIGAGLAAAAGAVRTWLPNHVPDVLWVLGSVSVAYGAGQYSRPAGFITIGVLEMVHAVIIARAESASDDEDRAA